MVVGLVEAVMIRPSQEACGYFSKKRSNGRDYQPKPDEGTKKENEASSQSAASVERLDSLVATLMILMERVLSYSDDSSMKENRDAKREHSRRNCSSSKALNSDDPNDTLHDDPSIDGISRDNLNRSTSTDLVNDPLKSESICSNNGISKDFGSKQEAHQEPPSFSIASQLREDLEEDAESFWRCFPTTRSQVKIGRKSCLKGAENTSAANTNTERKNETARTKIRNFLKRAQRSVHFGEVEIRHYGIELGDNPSCGSGPAISLSWEFSTTIDKNLDVYENMRVLRRHRDELRLTDREREEMLLENGITLLEQSAAMKSSAKDKIRRTRTLLNVKYSRYEEKLEYARDMMMKFLHLRKNDAEMMESLWKNVYLDEHEEVPTAALRHFRIQQRTFHSQCA